MTEITSLEEEGVIWMGEAANLTVIIHSKHSAILLRGRVLNELLEGGQKKWMTKRTTAAKVGEIRLVSVYQPHNGHVGGGEERGTVRGRHSIGRTNEAGEELTNWCEENNMCIVGSFYPHRRRGARFHRTLNIWYELDGFLMRCEQRHKHVRRMATIQEAAFSDHRPKMMELKTNVKKWRQAGRPSRAPNLRHEKLKDNETAMRYKEKTAEEVRRAEIDGRLQDGSKLWETLTDNGEMRERT